MPVKLSPSECAALAAKIAQLTDSYEQLLSGRKARVLVDQNGERIEFNGGNTRSLFAYLEGLKSEYANGCAVNLRPSSRGPIRPFF